MGLVKQIESDTEFTQELHLAATHVDGARLVVVDFFATWCGPCQQIAPFVSTLSQKYPHVTFLKVDCDKLDTLAASYQIRAMPTFVFLRNSARLDQVSGANPEALEAKVKSLAGDPSSVEGDGVVKGQMDLTPLVNKSGCECLNGSDDHPLEHVFNKTGGFLESDTDEQLIIYISYNQVVKLHSLKLMAPADSGPKTIRLYINQTSTPDFDACEGTLGLQDLSLTPEDMKEGVLIPLKYVKFQNVSSLTIFVKDNQSGSESTRIDYLSLIGSPVNTTNMSDFKRIAGKKGEQHA